MMTPELKYLSFSVVLGMAQLMLAASAATQQRGVAWNLSARDAKLPELTGVAGRLDRAFNNFKETFPFFLAAIFLVSILKVENTTSALGAQLYFFGRVLYVPLYATGTPVVRSLVWGVSLLGIVLVLSALL